MVFWNVAWPLKLVYESALMVCPLGRICSLVLLYSLFAGAVLVLSSVLLTPVPTFCSAYVTALLAVSQGSRQQIVVCLLAANDVAAPQLVSVVGLA
jgi:hypothetical protein